MSVAPPHLILLGTSAGKASAHRAASSYLLDLGDHGVLIDCGDGATRNFLAEGYRPEWVDHILITHTHADHVCGLPYFVQQRYLCGTDSPLTIHCPGEAAGPIKAIFNFGYMFKSKMPFHLSYKPHVSKWPLELPAVTVTPYPTTHLTAMREVAEQLELPNRGECYALRIEVGGIILLYSADLGALTDLDTVPGPVDWLLIETSHVSLDHLWPWAEERAIKRIILTHLSDDFDFDSVALAAKYTSAEVLVAEDRMRLPITR